jgi:hypothetical protein
MLSLPPALNKRSASDVPFALLPALVSIAT